MGGSFLTVLLVFGFSGAAMEVDDTIYYYAPIEDAEPTLNSMVEDGIGKALMAHTGCDLNAFGKLAARHLTGNLLYGAIEKSANDAPFIDKHKPAIKNSIYKGTPYETSMIGLLFGLGTVVRVGDYTIGTDKLGHFFDMGYSLFNIYKDGGTLSDLAEKSDSQQRGVWGLITTGVKSHADMVANFDGFRFWRDLLGQSSAPFFGCQDGTLLQIRKFAWSDYTSAGWSEAINCSTYSSPAYQTAIDKNIAALEAQTGRRYACPIEPNLCDDLRAQYAQWLPAGDIEKLISPACVNEQSSIRSGKQITRTVSF